MWSLWNYFPCDEVATVEYHLRGDPHTTNCFRVWHFIGKHPAAMGGLNPLFVGWVLLYLPRGRMGLSLVRICICSKFECNLVVYLNFNFGCWPPSFLKSFSSISSTLWATGGSRSDKRNSLCLNVVESTGCCLRTPEALAPMLSNSRRSVSRRTLRGWPSWFHPSSSVN